MKHTGRTSTKALSPSDSKVMIDDFLTPLLTQLTEDARRISPHYETLWQDIQQLYSAGGKRIRSYMTLLAYEAFSKKPAKTILPAAAAQELLHTAMLIHDDVIDRNDVRYGVKNMTGEYSNHYEELISDTIDRQHYANSAAILAGDLLISEAYSLITETVGDPAAILAVQKLVAKTLFHVVAGELLDTEAVFRGSDSADPLLIAAEKTASYSFVTPFLIGATLGDATPIQRDTLQKLGEQLGIGYQLRDDILGVFGDEAVTGKSADSDLKEGKRTFLIEEFMLLASPAQKAAFKALFGHHDMTKEAIESLKVLLTESGAKAVVETRITAYRDYAHTLLTSLAIDQAHQRAFSALIDMCLQREK